MTISIKQNIMTVPMPQPSFAPKPTLEYNGVWLNPISTTLQSLVLRLTLIITKLHFTLLISQFFFTLLIIDIEHITITHCLFLHVFRILMSKFTIL